MCDRIEAIAGRNWIEVVANSWNVSKYVLYGSSVDRIMQENSPHYHESALVSA